MNKLDEGLRKRLIDAIAAGKNDVLKDALDEVHGKVLRVRNFIDIMIASSIRGYPNNTTKIIYDLDPEVKKGFDEVAKRVAERKKEELTK